MDANSNPNQWQTSLITAIVKHCPLTEIFQALQAAVVVVEISHGDFTSKYAVASSKPQSYEDVRNFVKSVTMKYPSPGGIGLEYNGRIACVRPGFWIPLHDLPGARIHAQVPSFELAVKMRFRIALGTDAPFDIPDIEEHMPIAFGGEELRVWIRSTIATAIKAAVPPELAVLVDEFHTKQKIVCALGRWPNGGDKGLEEVLRDGASFWGETVYCDVSWPSYEASWLVDPLGGG